MPAASGDAGWTLLSNHGKVLLCVALDPEIRVSDIAHAVGIKERAVQRILADLRSEGFISSIREGRRNRYRVNRRQRLRWSPNGRLAVGDLVDVLDR
ncbi:MAG: helix-turn-helix domain-containing protein [Thermoleophilaceae bacterium]